MTEILFMVMCWLMCGVTCMVACFRFGFGPNPHADLAEYSAFALACLLLWPLLVVIAGIMVAIFMSSHVLGRLTRGLGNLVRQEETT